MCAGARAVLCCAVLCCVCARAGECARVHMSARARLCLDMLRTLYIYVHVCLCIHTVCISCVLCLWPECVLVLCRVVVL